MTFKEFNSLKGIQKYYNEETNTYIFKEDGNYINLIKFNFDLNIEANIDARNINAYDINARNIIAWNIKTRNIDARNIKALDINAWNIKALDIYARDINALNIEANDISYYAICFAYNSIKCKSIKGRRKNAKHFVLDGKLEVKENVD